MVLAFKPQFKNKILNGSKIHTIREDKADRWKPGRDIHMATGVRTIKYNQFSQRVCITVETFEIKYTRSTRKTTASVYVNNQLLGQALWVDCRIKVSSFTVDMLAANDGFETINEFFEWFHKDFKGKIIHWTDFKYQ